MASGDFLRKGAETPLVEHYLMAGVPGAISTNSESILAAARRCFSRAASPSREPKLRLRFWVDPEGSSQPPWPKPFFRGLDHFVFAGYDNQNSILINLQSRRAIGRFSPAMAADEARWRTVIFPNLLSLVGSAVGVTGLHCAGVVRDGKGILLAGGSGSGKSTLTMALLRRGFSFLSDDWTYLSQCEGGIRAWGLIPFMKILPPSARFFPELASLKTTVSVNGEEAFEIDPDTDLRVPRSRSCKPKMIVFLTRCTSPEFTLTQMPAADAVARLEESFLADTPEALAQQSEIVHRLVVGGCWHLRYGEGPDAVADKLAGIFAAAARD